MRVPFLDLGAATHELRAELAAAQQRVLDSGWYILGAECEAFEAEFAAYCGVRHCIGVGNGLEALYLILRAAGIGPGDEVIVPANTYIATWLAVSHVGATPVPVEPEFSTFNLDSALVEAAITPKTRAIIAVHLYGRTANMTALTRVARQHGLSLFEDAAQAHGARHRGRRSGALSDAAGFSFYPTKNLGALGDAGAVTTNDDALAERVRLLRNYGSARKGHNAVAGYNSRLDELQAAILRAKLEHLDAWNLRRLAIARVYHQALTLTGLTLPPNDQGADDIWHLFVARTPHRDQLQAMLTADGIGTDIHYPVPPHLQPAYKQLGLPRGHLPITERIHDEVISLPVSAQLSIDDAHRVASAVRRAMQELA